MGVFAACLFVGVKCSYLQIKSYEGGTYEQFGSVQ